MSTEIQAVASEAASWFETATRTDDSRFTRLKDGAPEWLTDLVYDAHGDMLPDDWRYSCIRAAVDAIDEAGADEDPGDLAHEFADGYVDVYTAARYEWLSSHGSRQGYIDEAVSELGIEPTADVGEMIGWGQYQEAREVFASVLDSLEQQAEIREAIEDGEALEASILDPQMSDDGLTAA